MSATIEIKLADSARALLANVAKLPEEIKEAIRAGMDEQNIHTVSHIQRQYLSFPKHGKTTLEGLRAVSTPGYRGSLHSWPAVVNGNSVTSSIGSNITANGFSYPTLHEFGGNFTRTSKPGSVRLRLDARGNLLRQGKNGKLAVFARSTHTRAKEVSFAGGKTYTVNVPARAPISRGINDTLKDYSRTISARIELAFRNLGGSA